MKLIMVGMTCGMWSSYVWETTLDIPPDDIKKIGYHIGPLVQ
jgi:hypothetical protein